MADSERVLVVGVGGLGIPAALSLARAGISALGLVDPETVELSNLARQVIFASSDIGQPKAEATARRLRLDYPGLLVETFRVALDRGNAARLIAEWDFIIDATDDPAAKFLINESCVAAGRALVYGGVLGMRGQAMTVIPGRTACLRCLFEEAPAADELQTCREAGIIGPVAAAIGEIEAAEALAYLRGRTPALAGRILTYDAASGRVRTSRVFPRSGCGCGAARAAFEAAARQ